MAKSMALHQHGYNVVWWIKPGVKESEVIEYVPRDTWQTSSILPRITIESYDDQVKLHRALGLGIVSRGENWNKRENATPGLFDHLEEMESKP